MAPAESPESQPESSGRSVTPGSAVPGASDTDHDEVAAALTAAREGSRRGRLAVAAVLTALVLVGASLAIGRASVQQDAPPTDTSAEAGFARDMQVHHNQAVEMAMIVRDRTADPDTRLLAYDIATSQAQQSGQMFGWLASWGLPQAAGQPAMTWMTLPALNGGNGHEHGTGTPAHRPGDEMPGMASREQLDSLRAATGVDAERQFLTLMIAHHAGGVEMAQAVLARSRNPAALALATAIVTAQSSEITVMEQMLAER